MSLLLCSSWGLEAQHNSSSWQREFYCEKGVNRPTALPNALMKVFVQDETVQEALDQAKTKTLVVPAGWYQATVIHLSLTSETDYLIVGRFPLGGAHASAIWIYRPSGTNWKAVFVGGGDRIVILRSGKYGLSDVETDYFAADSEATIYRFDGNSYKPYDSKRIR